MARDGSASEKSWKAHGKVDTTVGDEYSEKFIVIHLKLLKVQRSLISISTANAFGPSQLINYVCIAVPFVRSPPKYAQ
jgi:hypothetical protein